MNWYEELFVKNDVRLPENHRVVKNHLYDGSSESNRWGGIMKIDDTSDLKIGQSLWIKLNQMTTYIHGTIDYIGDFSARYRKVRDGLPNHIMVCNHYTKFCFQRSRVGPSVITVDHDGKIICQFCIREKTSYDFIDDMSAKFVSIEVVENDVVNPLDTEFFKDPILKMEYASLVANARENPPAYATSKMNRFLEQL